jgi:hypothetical protein
MNGQGSTSEISPRQIQGKSLQRATISCIEPLALFGSVNEPLRLSALSAVIWRAQMLIHLPQEYSVGTFIVVVVKIIFQEQHTWQSQTRHVAGEVGRLG